MQKGIHPESMECTATCACGNTFTVLSTQPALKLDICNKCHPFYTGQDKMVDTTGRVEKFKKKYGLQ